MNETFSHSTFDQAGWVVGGQNSNYTPVLTASGSNPIDASGSGWLRMTNDQGAEATFARLTTPIPSANNNVSVDLKFQMWTRNATGADGFTISLRDASIPFASDGSSVGAYGGSLGYAQKNQAAPGGSDQTHAGMAGGYFSVGVDAFGNFSNPTEGRVGGPGSTPDSVAVRGPGSGTGTTYTYTDSNGNLVTANNYDYLTGTSNLTSTLGKLNFTNVTNGVRPVDASASNAREIVFNFTTTNILTVSLRFGTGTLTQVLQTDLSSLGIRPENLELVFTAGTGGSMQTTEIQGLSITTSGAPVGTVYYSNYAGDNAWGNGNNWGNAVTANLGVVPTANANLVFSNHQFTSPSTFQLTTAQNVDLGGNRSAGSLQFDAPFNYTLQGYNLTLDSGQANTPTAITVTSAAPGGAHTVQSAITLNSDLNINTNTGTALNLSGAIAAGTHTFTLNNNGTTTFGGQITGSGTMTQTAGSTGTTVITGNSSSSYTGNIVVQDGTLRLGNDNVLNAGTNLSLSTANSFGTFDLANHSQTLGGVTFVSGGLIQTGSGTLTLGGNVTSQASATTATITGNLNLGASNRTFSVADGGVTPDMAISANISGTGGLVKTGNGSLTLSGVNTYSGTTSLSAGTIIAASNSALGSGTATVSPSATLALQGGITLSSGTIGVSGNGYTASNGAIDNRSGNNTLASDLLLNGNTIVGAASGTTLTLGGNISQSTASNLTTGGAGTVVLGGNNSYTGTTTVTSGTVLVASANNALGTTAAGTTVNSGGALAFQGGVNYSTAEAVTVTGTGTGTSNGAIDNLSGNNTFAGNISLGGATRFGAASGTNLTLNGVVSGASALTVGGNGSITLGGNNSYSGGTTVNSGATLIAASNNALGNNGATATTVTNGGTLGLQGGVTIGGETVTINGAGASSNGAITSVSGANTLTNQLVLGSSATVGAAAGSTLTLTNGITAGNATFNLTKADAGTVVIAGASTYGGTTTITGGNLTLASAGSLSSVGNVTVTNGALILDNSGTNSNARLGNTAPIVLNDGTVRFIGNGAANSTETLGTVTANTGANTVYLQAAATKQADLTISNLTQNGSATVTFMTDPTATLGAGATSAGTPGSPRVFLTQVSGAAPTGTIAAPSTLPGWILVNDATGSANFAEYTGAAGTGNGVRALSSYYTGALGINVNDPTKSVLLNAASASAAWTLTHAGTTTDANLKIVDAPTVSLGGNATWVLRLNSGGLIKSGNTSTTISGSGGLSGGTNGILAVTTDNAAGVLTISAPIVDNGTTGLTKSGPGLLVLSGANTFTGNVNINDGTLRINAENGLGSTTAAKTITFNGGTLNVTGNIIGNAAKTWTIGANGTGTFDINSGVSMTLPGAGDLTATATSQLIKAGTGTLVLGAANTGFLGSTLVNAGTLELDAGNALGTNRPLTLAGGTLALKGNTTITNFTTAITVTADSTVSVDRLNGTSTNQVLTATSLSIGSNTLNIANGTPAAGNFYDMKLGSVTVTGSAVLNTANVGTDLQVGAITGSGSITKTGAADMYMTAASTYTGATTVNGGTLYTQGTNYLPTTTALTIADGSAVVTGNSTQTIASLASTGATGNAVLNLGTGALTVGDSTSTSYSGTITASGFTKNGSGSLTLGGGTGNTLGSFTLNDGTIVANKTAGDATGSGNVTIGDGNGGLNTAMLQLARAGQVNDASNVTINTDGRFDLNNNNETIGSLAGSGSVNLGSATLTMGNTLSTTYSGQIGGSGNLVKNGTGTMLLSGNNQYLGTTTINAGTVQAATSNALGIGTTTGGVTVALGAGLELQNNINILGKALSINGTGASGAGALRNITGDNTWGGAVTLAGASTINVTAGNLYLGSGISMGGNALTVAGAGNTQSNGSVTGTAGITKTGAGALVLAGTGNTYSGATTVSGGSLQFNANGAGPASSDVNLAAVGTTLNVNNFTGSVGSLSGVDSSFVSLGSGSLTTGGTNANTNYSGTISGTGGSLTKIGTGTMTLGGNSANTFTGSLNVNTGTVILAKNATGNSVGTTTINVGDGSGTAATLQLGGANQINDLAAITLGSNGKLDLNGNTERIGSLASASSASQVTLGGATLYTGNNNGTTTYAGTISGTGSLIKEGSGTLTLAATNSFAGATTVNGGTLVMTATNALSTTGSLTITSGNATFGTGTSLTQTITGLSVSSGASLAVGGNATLTVSTAAASSLLGSLNGAGKIIFTGGGDVTFGGGINFGGEVNLTGGTFHLGGNVSLGTLSITGNTILDFGNSTATTLNVGTLNIAAGVQVTVINWVNLSDYFYAALFPGAVLNQRGNTPVPNNTSTQITFDPPTYTSNQTAWQAYDHQITPAPEPATYGAIFVGAVLGCFGLKRWRKRRTALG